jgi:NADH-quinone oxidoreductase subunit I
MAGQGFIKGMMLTLRHFLKTYAEDFRYGLRRYAPDVNNFETRQGTEAEGVFTVQYPEEKIAAPERFRFVPFLVVQDWDDELNPGKDWCTSCGICAKVCPPQCIWIVRTEDPVTGRPIPEPEAFFIDIDICMNCGFCAEFCPFDAIKMDHDYELASYDRTSNHIYDKPKLSKEQRYWKQIAPTRAEEEAKARGGWEHKNYAKSWNTSKPTAAGEATDEKEMKREEVRSRKAAAEPTQTTVQGSPEAAAAAATTTGSASAPEGTTPWNESSDEKERRKQEALARKAARAAKKGE